LTGDNKLPKDEVHELISKGRKRGYLLFEEVDKTFQHEAKSEGNFNEFLSSMDNYGIKILDKQRKAHPKKRKSDIVSLEGLERTTDPVKLYLREMGNISLLTREGEIAIAREIERGEKSIVKALSKTRLVLNTILSIEERIDEEENLIQEMFETSDEDLSEGKIEERKKQIISKIQEIRELGRQLDKIPSKKKNDIARERYIVIMSRLIRDFNIQLSQREIIIQGLGTY
jgi:RNA polymerase primary sigma factor